MKFYILILSVLFLNACQLVVGQDEDLSTVETIEGSPSSGSLDIYASSNLEHLCLQTTCLPSYPELPDVWMDQSNGENCFFNSFPNEDSTFIVKQPSRVNGLQLKLSKEDLFFIAWTSMRYRINPHFILATMVMESAGNCAAVSGSAAEGCFQITNTFGQGQLNDSYPNRVADWHWSSRSGVYYPASVFVDEISYFGELPLSDQYRITLDPLSPRINGEDISSIVNFHFGVIAMGLYHYWQQYLLYYYYDDVQTPSESIIALPSEKARWQAAAYHGGAFGAGRAIRIGGVDFLDEMNTDTQFYADAVVDACDQFEQATSVYEAQYSQDDVEYIIDLLHQTYPADANIDWDAVKDDVEQVFFSEENTTLSFVDDVKALIYVISTFSAQLAPQWPDASSIGY